MNEQTRVLPTDSTGNAVDVTLDASADVVLSNQPTSGQSDSGSGPRIHLVEGSGPCMVSEMAQLLRTRLRAASAVLFAGFFVFLFWVPFARDMNRSVSWWFYGGQIFVTVLLGLNAFLLSRKCNISEGLLRAKEWVTFGVITIYFVMMQAIESTEYVAKFGTVPIRSGPWLIVMFTYALFIPNTWRRAAIVVGALSLGPVFGLCGLWLFHAESATALSAQPTIFFDVLLVMAVAAASSLVGVHFIGKLRKREFKARQMGQYSLRQQIGAGGMGEVYLAEHKLMKRPCAIKLIRADKAGDPNTLARFEREVKATAKLSHWNSVEIFDYGHTDDGTFYYVMEFLPGMNLQEVVARFGRLPAERVIHLLEQTCGALSEAHQQGMIHRDLKPANIFAAHRGGQYDVAKLLDFGLVKPLGGGGGDDNEIGLTMEGTITGSPLYMSPEQASGDSEPDGRSDIYSLGAIGYFLLTGRPPFDYDRPLKVLMAHGQETPQPPSEIQPDVPPDLEEVILRCLEKSPDDRFQCVWQFREALLGCQAAGNWSRDDARNWWQQHDQAAVTEQPRAEPAMA